MPNLNLIQFSFNKTIFLITLHLYSIGIIAQDIPLLNKKITLQENGEVQAKDYIGFYQKYISDLRGVDCPMEPSCSNYALESISKYGFVQGVVNGMDRLVRCGHEQQYYRTTFTKRGIKLLDSNYDSVNANSSIKREIQFYPYSNTEDNKVLELVIHLIQQQLYHEALLEINRVKITKVSSTLLTAYEMLCLNAIGQYEKAIWLYETKIDQKQKTEPEILRQYYTAYYKTGNYRKVIEAVDYPYIKKPDPNLGYIRTLVFNAFLKESQTYRATKFLDECKSIIPEHEKYKNVLNETGMQRQKSPFIAGISSVIIPGAGYVYGGHVKTGISSLLFNSLFGFATYSNFKSGNTGMGILTGLFGLAFYISNVQGSVRSVHRYNKMTYENIIDRFEKQTIIYH